MLVRNIARWPESFSRRVRGLLLAEAVSDRRVGLLLARCLSLADGAAQVEVLRRIAETDADPELRADAESLIGPLLQGR